MMVIAVFLITFIYMLRIHNEAKYKYLIKKREKYDFENLKNSKVLRKYSNNMQDF